MANDSGRGRWLLSVWLRNGSLEAAVASTRRRDLAISAAILLLLLITGAATRDPRAFDNPDDFDIERVPGISIGFGHGVHSCLGAALARMESRIALEEIAKRWRKLEIDDAGLRRVHMSNVAGYSHVPVRVTH